MTNENDFTYKSGALLIGSLLWDEQSGRRVIYIRDLLGHSSVTTTEIYASTNPEFLRNAIDKASSKTPKLYFDKR